MQEIPYQNFISRFNFAYNKNISSKGETSLHTQLTFEIEAFISLDSK